MLINAGTAFSSPNKASSCALTARAAFGSVIVQMLLNAKKALCQFTNLFDLILTQLLDQTYQFTSTHSVSPHLSLMVFDGAIILWNMTNKTD